MKKFIIAIMALATFTLTGCAAVCNPQGAATMVGNSNGLLAVAQLGACAAYVGATKVVNAVKEKSANEERAQRAAIPVFTGISSAKYHAETIKPVASVYADEEATRADSTPAGK